MRGKIKREQVERMKVDGIDTRFDMVNSRLDKIEGWFEQEIEYRRDKEKEDERSFGIRLLIIITFIFGMFIGAIIW